MWKLNIIFINLMVKQLNEHRKIFSRIGFNYLALALIPILFQILLVNIISLWDATLIRDTNFQTVLSSLTNYILILPIFMYLMGKIKSSKIDKERLNLKKTIEYFCIALTLMWIGNLIGMVITTIIGNTLTNDVINPIEQLIQNSSIYVNLLVISILAPIFEELFFRKLLIDRTIKYGAKLSIFLSALIFALFHGNLSQFFYAFLLGGFFAFVYIKTGKIIYSISLHAFVNFFGSVASIFFSTSLNNIIQNINSANIGDITIVAAYSIILLFAWIVGLNSIFKKYNKIEFDDSEREVYLEKPIATSLLNVGMILFIAYHILRIMMTLKII